jgi:hypothetical protein
MKLEDEGSIPKSELDNVRTATFLPGVESGLRFSVESSNARHDDLPASLFDRLKSFWKVNAFQGKPLERLEQSGFSFRRSNESHLLMLAGAAFWCRGKRAETVGGHFFNRSTRFQVLILQRPQPILGLGLKGPLQPRLGLIQFLVESHV